MSEYLGKIISGAKIISQLGSGGGGLVFLASHPEYGEKVVIKILPQDRFSDKEMVERFKREIKIMQKVHHPNIVKVFKCGEENNCCFLIMEYLDGMDLDTYVALKGALDQKTAVNLIFQTLNALKAAHDNDIIHRDIKPSNILSDIYLKDAYICDFGLAKDLTQDTGLTQAGAILGTPNFMSPEQWFGTSEVTIQSDIYSLGASFFYLITGSKPIEGDDTTAVMTNSLFSEVPDVAKLLPDIPADLNKVISKMMAREPEKRYANVQDVINDLSKVGKKKGLFAKIFGK